MPSSGRVPQVNVASLGPDPNTPLFNVRMVMPIPPDSEEDGTASLAGLDPARLSPLGVQLYTLTTQPAPRSAWECQDSRAWQGDPGSNTGCVQLRYGVLSAQPTHLPVAAGDAIPQPLPWPRDHEERRRAGGVVLVECWQHGGARQGVGGVAGTQGNTLHKTRDVFNKAHKIAHAFLIKVGGTRSIFNKTLYFYTFEP